MTSAEALKIALDLAIKHECQERDKRISELEGKLKEIECFANNLNLRSDNWRFNLQSELTELLK